MNALLFSVPAFVYRLKQEMIFVIFSSAFFTLS